jgi:hypothetical protein
MHQLTLHWSLHQSTAKPSDLVLRTHVVAALLDTRDKKHKHACTNTNEEKIVRFCPTSEIDGGGAQHIGEGSSGTGEKISGGKQTFDGS